MLKNKMKIDLHTHTTASDGRITPRELVKKAKKIGLSAIAITDHDTINYEKLVKSSKIIIDTRGRLKNKISKKIYII